MATKAEPKTPKSKTFSDRFDEAFSVNGTPREQVLDGLAEAWRSPVLSLAVTLVPGRGPVIASNVANNDADQIEMMAGTLDGLANEFRAMATQQLKRQLRELKESPAEA